MANDVTVKDIGQQAITQMLNQVNSFANLENTQLTKKETQYAVGIITNINKKVVSDKLKWGDLDIVGCQLPAQIKRFARLNLQLENQEIFIDIRNNGKTGLKDINLKLQYQGLEKLLMKYCTFGDKKIIRFYKDVICKGDKIVEKPNLSTGLLELKDHEYFQTDDVDYRNKLENIIGAYAIAYVEENGKLNPYVAKIDKNRIERAKSSAMTQNIWNKDTRKMVLKTAVIELYNSLKPFIVMPQDLVTELDNINKSETDFSKDFTHENFEDVKEEVKETVATEEIEAEFEEIDEETGVVETKEKFTQYNENLYD